ncbi:unnamed protein product [Adineta steineri]|uniref:F-box domain-containing protein n=1 Tax=Adineta steineri TaxID=433720 RepID=A0A819DIG4_9BILA|nr:unnamed protein product [Adineta steineri]CAF3828688.1 unnamed protein product [Adineta steineri]
MTMKFEFLPNEILIECFQYLNAPDVFYSFDQLNYHFNTLIRTIPLRLNFEKFKKSKFNQFCQIILSNPELKHQIISLKLSNNGTRGQTGEFLSLFPLNEFINLRSLSLIDLKEENVEQLRPMLALLSNLYYFSYTDLEYYILKILSMLLTSKLRILSIPVFEYSTSILEQMSITSLTISSCSWNTLSEVLEYALALNYLKIERLYNDVGGDYPLNYFTKNAVRLKQLIINDCEADFEMIEKRLKSTPNLTIFTTKTNIYASVINADRWQHLIESSLLHLRVFNFCFSCFISTDSYNDMLNKFQQFQTNFWSKQHHWHTNYEINKNSASIYTMPYVWNKYTLVTSINNYGNLNGFDKVTELVLSQMTIKYNSPYYFNNVKSLELINEDHFDIHPDEYMLQKDQIKFLNNIVNLSNIEHLKIPESDYISSSSLLLEILKELPNVSSLEINKRSLILFVKDHELRKYLNTKITTLYLNKKTATKRLYTFGSRVEYIQYEEVGLLLQAFSNLEQLYCNFQYFIHLFLVLEKFSKLSIITSRYITKEVHSWIRENASKFDVYIDFCEIYNDYDDDDDDDD